MNFVRLCDFESTLDGLRLALTTALGPEHDLLATAFVEPPLALFVIEVAKRTPDSAACFPHGKWATIQRMQAAVDRELDQLVGEVKR